MFWNRRKSSARHVAQHTVAQVSLLGRVPSRPGVVRYGIDDAPERSFFAWLEHTVAMARNVLPSRAIRFVISPLRTPMIGVWVPSRDAYGEPFPLVFVRRLRSGTPAAGQGASRAEAHPGFGRPHKTPRDSHPQRSREPRKVGELSWTLQLAACAHYLTAAESCLMLGQEDSPFEVWRALEALPMPAQADLASLCQDAQRGLEHELIGDFTARTLGAPPHAPALASAIRRLRAPLASVSDIQRGTQTARASRDDAHAEYATLALPAHDEFDLFAWLELLRAQRLPSATPRAVFWCPADKRALASLGVPAPTLVTFLRQPRADEVQRLPLASDPDECPAWDAELQSSIGGCSTLMQLRAAMRCATLEPAPAQHAFTERKSVRESGERTVAAVDPQAPSPAVPCNANEHAAPRTNTDRRTRHEPRHRDLNASVQFAASSRDAWHAARDAQGSQHPASASGFAHAPAMHVPSEPATARHANEPLYSARVTPSNDALEREQSEVDVTIARFMRRAVLRPQPSGEVCAARELNPAMQHDIEPSLATHHTPHPPPLASERRAAAHHAHNRDPSQQPHTNERHPAAHHAHSSAHSQQPHTHEPCAAAHDAPSRAQPQQPHTHEPPTVPCNPPLAAFIHANEPPTVPCGPRFDARLYDHHHTDPITPRQTHRTTEPLSPFNPPPTPKPPAERVPFSLSDLPSANPRIRRKIIAPACDPLPPEAAAFQPPPLGYTCTSHAAAKTDPQNPNRARAAVDRRGRAPNYEPPNQRPSRVQ